MDVLSWQGTALRSRLFVREKMFVLVIRGRGGVHAEIPAAAAAAAAAAADPALR